MDENVVFNTNGQSDQAGTPPDPNDPNAQTPQDQTPVDPAIEGTVDPNADPNAVDPNAVDPTTGEPLADGAGSDGTEEIYEEEPPDFSHSPLFKKILIGLGILVFFIIIISVIGSLFKGQPKNVKLTWWMVWEDCNTVQPLIIDFKKAHPTIDIECIKKTPTQYREQLMAQIKNGTGPDIFRYHNTWLPMLQKDNDVAALTTDAIAPDDFQKMYYPVMVKDLSQKGAIYGIPMEADTLELFVNPQLLNAAGVDVPTTWDEFNKAATALTVKTSDNKIKKSGAALGTYSNVTHAPDIISMLMVQQGVDINKLADDTKDEAGALAFYGSFGHGDSAVWDTNLDPSLIAFSKGNLAMYFGFSWDVFAIQQLSPNLQFKVYPVPSNQTTKTTIASYWVEGVSGKSSHQKEAMEFMNYLTQKSTLENFYTLTRKTRAFGELYPRKDMQSELQDDPYAAPFVQGMNNASSSFFASDTHDGDTGINSLMNTYLQKAVEQLTGDPNSASGVVDDLNNGVTQVLQSYVPQ